MNKNFGAFGHQDEMRKEPVQLPSLP